MATYVREQGLTAAEAAARRARDGPNVLPSPPPPSLLLLLMAQLTHFFAVLLWVAAGLAAIAGMPQLAAAIAVVVVVNGVFAFLQERRAERAAERLRELLPRRARVRRDGAPIEIEVSELVTGDVVLLEGGDRVSADLQVTEAHALLLDTSLLTGESVPTPVDVGAGLFAGTFVVEGEGVAVVTAIGGATRLAAIAALTSDAPRPPTPLARELHRVVRIIAVIAVGVGVAFFALSLAIGTPATDGFLFAVGVTVALVPEGLLPTVTLSLAVGAQRMARRNALVRRLEAVESLGSVTFICTDKTGTLTRNEMSVVRVWTPSGSVIVRGDGYEPGADVEGEPAPRRLAREASLVAARCSTGHVEEVDGRWVPVGDPMEAAIVTLASRMGAAPAEDARRDPVLARHPFDPRRRRMSIVTESGRVCVKGATETMFERCRPVDGAVEAAEALASAGLRVLAVAQRTLPRPPGPGATMDDVEHDLELVGLLALQDPPRTGAAEAIARCRRLGVKLAMLTGDHPATAKAIADQVGLRGPDSPVIVGDELPDDDAMLRALVDRDGVVVSRVSPEDKLRLAAALQAAGHVVAMTGDGVNDGPALRAADVGVAMGRSGTDVAREAADVVLLDDDIATLVAGIELGRATYANIGRFLTYHLTDNVAELTPFVLWALSGGRFPLAIGVIQVLCLDIGTDMLPALALGAEPPHADPDESPVRDRLLDRLVLRRAFAVLGPTEALVEMAAFVTGLVVAGWRPGRSFPTGHALKAASGAAFAAVVIGQMGNAWVCRTAHHRRDRPSWRTNPLLVAAIAAELAALAGFLFVAPVARLLGQAPPVLGAAVVAVLAAPAVVLADRIDERRRERVGARRSG